MNGSELGLGLDGDLYSNDVGGLEIVHGIDLVRQDMMHVLYQMPIDYLVGRLSKDIQLIEARLKNWLREQLPLRNPIDPNQLDVNVAFKYPTRRDFLTIKIFIRTRANTLKLLLPNLFWVNGFGFYPVGTSISYDIMPEERTRRPNSNDPSIVGAILNERQRIRDIVGLPQDFPLVANIQRELNNAMFAAGGDIVSNNDFITGEQLPEIQNRAQPVPGAVATEILRNKLFVSDIANPSVIQDFVGRQYGDPENNYEFLGSSVFTPDRGDQNILTGSEAILRQVLNDANRNTIAYPIEAVEEVVTVGQYKSDPSGLIIQGSWIGEPVSKLPLSYEPANNVFVVSLMGNAKVKGNDNFDKLTFANLNNAYKSRLWFTRDLLNVFREFVNEEYLAIFGLALSDETEKFKTLVNESISYLNRIIESGISRLFYAGLLGYLKIDFINMMVWLQNQIFIDYYNRFPLDISIPPMGSFMNINFVSLPYESFAILRQGIRTSTLFALNNIDAKPIIESFIKLVESIARDVKQEQSITPGPERNNDVAREVEIGTREIERIVELPGPGNYSIYDLMDLSSIKRSTSKGVFISEVDMKPILDTSAPKFASFDFIRGIDFGYSLQGLTGDKLIVLTLDRKNILVFPTVYFPNNMFPQVDKDGNIIKNDSDRIQFNFRPIQVKLTVRYIDSIAKSITRSRIRLPESLIFPMQRNTARWEANFDTSFEPGQYLIHYDRYIIANNEAIKDNFEVQYSYASAL